MKLGSKIGMGLALLTLGTGLLAPSARAVDYKHVELKTPATIAREYGATVPDYVYSNWDDIRELQFNTQPVSCEVGDGNFVGNPINRTETYYPLELIGVSKERSVLDINLRVQGGITMRDIGVRREVSPDGTSSKIVVKDGDATVENCKFSDYALLYLNSSYGFGVTDNTFENIKGNYGLKFHSVDPLLDRQRSLRRNSFIDMEVALLLSKGVDAGIGDSIGENVFLDCDLAIKDDYNADTWFEGNSWIDTVVKGNKSTLNFYTEPSEILDRFVENDNGGIVHVGNALDYNPLIPSTDPTGTDRDGDWLPDVWEEHYGLDADSAVGINGRNGDFEGDGRTNWQEFSWANHSRNPRPGLGTDPTSSNTDGDEYSDLYEWRWGTDPNNPKDPPAGTLSEDNTFYTGFSGLTVPWFTETGLERTLRNSGAEVQGFKDSRNSKDLASDALKLGLASAGVAVAGAAAFRKPKRKRG